VAKKIHAIFYEISHKSWLGVSFFAAGELS